MPFQILLTDVFNQHILVPEHMTMQQLYDTSMTIFDRNQLSPTITKNQTSVTAVSIVGNDNQNTPSRKDAKFQVGNNWLNSIKIRDHYTAYREDFIRMLEPINSMWDWHLRNMKNIIGKSELSPLSTRTINFIL